jgi:hypothetical protein
MYVNAWQAMPRGGGDIYVETDNVAVGLREAHFLNIEAGDYVRITITDTGCGMDKETCGRIFEPFFSTKEKSQGVGLSLSSAYGIVKEHGGTIEVDSEPGQGTIFSIYFPASSKDIAKEASTAKVMTTAGETILLIDDEESVLDVCKEILISMGYNVLTAENGRKACGFMRCSKIKLIW